jgi:hypothetical protein
MLSPSIDHYPFDMMEGEDGQRYDSSVTVEQRFPLSGVRGYRRAAARADAQRAKALANGTELDVVLEATEICLCSWNAGACDACSMNSFGARGRC